MKPIEDEHPYIFLDGVYLKRSFYNQSKRNVRKIPDTTKSLVPLKRIVFQVLAKAYLPKNRVETQSK